MKKTKKFLRFFWLILMFFIIFIFYFLQNSLNKNRLEKFVQVNIEIEENEYNKVTVSDAKSFISAIEDDNIKIIQIENDIDLGYNLLKENGIESDYITEHNQPLTHPRLKRSGISKIRIKNKDGLIICSKQGNKILHANIVIEDSKNVKIDNIKFEELWEWDEYTQANYSRNDWDYITIKNSDSINIKNCEFSKAYDGITDIKNSKNITIEYCKLNEINIDEDEFFNEQFEELEKNIDEYPMYNFLRKDVGLDINKIKELSSYQFKLYTIGTEDNCNKNENIVIHDNMYFNIKTRIPLARNSSVYLYNIYADQSKINYNIISKSDLWKIKRKYPKFVSLSTHGIIAIQRAYVVEENCLYYGVKHRYTSYRGFSISNLGRIIKKSKLNDLSCLKEYLQGKTGTNNLE